MDVNSIELCCPKCRGELGRPSAEELVCRNCGQRYAVVMGIPDLRVFPDPYIGFEEERAKVQKLAARYADFDFDAFVDYYYSLTSVVPAQHAQMYRRGLLAASSRAEAWLESWDDPAGRTIAEEDSLLEVGCGTAPLLSVAGRFPRRVGMDIALRWLVVGKKRLEQARLQIPLVAACAEALPFADEAFTHVAAESALEHVADQRKSLAEMHRVLRAGGKLYLTTPNRFSLGPDPQTGIWCGSFLPAAWTGALVRRAGGIPPKRHLLSVKELKARLRGAGFEKIRISLPGIPEGMRRHLSAGLRGAVSVYELMRRLPGSRELLFLFGPLFHAEASKPEAPGKT